MKMVVRTENSTYEINPETYQIRKVFSVNDATHRITDDWKTYHSISEVQVGSPLTVLWSMEFTERDSKLDSPEILFKTTVTSTVKEVIHKPLEQVVN